LRETLLSPSITSFDYPSSNMRKLSFPGAPEPQQPNLHLCMYPGCNWSFKRGEHLKRHMVVHTRERPFICSFPGCKRSFSRLDNLNVHFRTHSGCFVTPPAFLQQPLQREHLRLDIFERSNHPPMNSPPKPISRQYPQYDFSGLERLAAAACSTMARENNLYPPQKEDEAKVVCTDLDDEGRPIKYYVCQFRGCDMKFKRSEHLTRHRLVHTMERPFACSYPGCNKAFSRMDNLRQHFRIHSRPSSQTPQFLSVAEPYPASHPFLRKRRL
ncbi:hypothetical protein L0F63_004319, partial [Massospora cicadina]